MSEFRKAKKSVEVTSGESVRILRELQELSQNDLAKLTGIPQSTISAIENDRGRLCGVGDTFERYCRNVHSKGLILTPGFQTQNASQMAGSARYCGSVTMISWSMRVSFSLSVNRSTISTFSL